MKVPYEIGFKPAALRQLRKLNSELQAQILAGIELLSSDPYPDGCKKLKGAENLYRIRVANQYRVVYEVKERQLLITVVKIGHRREVYR